MQFLKIETTAHGCVSMAHKKLANQLANPKNNLTPLIEIGLYHSLINPTFSRLGLTASLTNTCPKKFISRFAKLVLV